MEEIKLTQYSKASGCGCKIAPQVLQEILKTDTKFTCKELLVGNSTSDDAAVYDLGNDTCLVSTTDFFMPIVDSAYDFGRVAAANAISDVYAMGGNPIMAIAILGWPTEKLGTELAKQVLDGARSICLEANIPLAGGHSIESTEPIFGLSVNGIVTKKNLKENHTISPGNLIYLTKALGTGVYSTAIKRGKINEGDYKELIETMTTLNKIGTELGKLDYVTAITDVTGFGLNGHMLEMIGDKNLTATIDKSKIKTLNHLQDYISQFIYPDNTTRNFNACDKQVKGMEDLEFMIYCDPQTSGGLLFTIDADKQFEFEKWLKENKFSAWLIGDVSDKKTVAIEYI